MVAIVAKKRKFIIGSILILCLVPLYIKYYYWGDFKYESSSPNGQYIIKYYKSNQWLSNAAHILTLKTEKCSVEWIRLYDIDGEKLAEDRASDCLLGDVRWDHNGVEYYVEDGPIYRELPTNPVVQTN